MSGASFIRYAFTCFYARVFVLSKSFIIIFFGVVKVRPKPKRQYHARLEKVKEYLETVKDFDELISPQSLFFHFLNPEPSNKVQRDNETIKKSKYINDIYIYIYIFKGINHCFLHIL